MDFGGGKEGEFGFIRHLRERFEKGEGVEVGLGDDAAVLHIGGERLLFTTDMMVEGVHFDSAYTAADCLGSKAIACNVSDIAAMGGRPLFAVVSVAFPRGPQSIDPYGLVDGLQDGSRMYSVALVGGDTTSGPALTISVAMIGSVSAAGPVLRSGAREGDLLCVTGTVGDAAAGLQLMKSPGDSGERKRFATLIQAHDYGRARVREGTAAASCGVTAMIDVSDGVGTDANHLAEESGLGLEVRVENLPLSHELRDAASEMGLDAHRLAVSGGEDYELLMAIHPHDVDMLRDAVAPTPLTVIGEFTKGGERFARWPDGSKTPLEGLGWDHFR